MFEQITTIPTMVQIDHATPLELTGSPVSIDDVEAVACHGRPVTIAEVVHDKVAASRAVIDVHAAGASAIYGVNTGFGSLSRQRIDPEGIRDVQRNLIRSHAAGVGDPLPAHIVRGMMLILAASLSRGHSGVRPVVIERIVDLLNHDITPVIPSRGSVGASGDLAPLAHMVLVLIGEGQADINGQTMPGLEALKQAGLDPIVLQAKEGLALINGTHLMCAIGCHVLRQVQHLQRAAVLSAAMAIDACRGTDAFLDHRLHLARNQPGQQRIAHELLEALRGSQIIPAHLENDPRVQDPYCLRAMPQVLGAAWDTIEHVRTVFTYELGAVTDNPQIFLRNVDEPINPQIPVAGSVKHLRTQDSNDEVAIISGGNFHGMPLAIALDSLTIALTHIAGIAERRIYWLLAASDSENPVNVYLSPQPGLHSGMMIVQYTAAACCNELQTLCTPASVANIPTSAGIEDYNSFGATAAHQALAALDLARNVIAMELYVMCEALEYQRPLRSGEAVEGAYARVRHVVPRLTVDRPPAPDIAAIAELIAEGAFIDTV
jgi:histidine ammonia-lyase